ncbi:MAG: TetM/TetW/TetO/TetS family tetracycline resistance ribosomal protection protein [Lachnospiraceae bacterium]|nr:TetM/TetW/TetO/TetS family tetracycline resistance ribosomal protection protein [Lachnospiraceae bacterium]
MGIIAHVDSGKTTLSEAVLFRTGVIRSFGRVDKGASFFDNNQLERARGITIYNKQTTFQYGQTIFNMIDTPGHADFSSEMERSLQVLDYAVLLISAADGVKGQTQTIWRLLSEYNIPTFIFFNKMDQERADKAVLLKEIRELSSDLAVDFSDDGSDEFFDRVAMSSEDAMEEFLSKGTLTDETISALIANRQIFPCYFGSALQIQGIDEFLFGFDKYTMDFYPEELTNEEFGARVYKIDHADDGSRLTFIKVTQGVLNTKTLLPDGEDSSKINQIRLYSGNKYQLAEKVSAGDICALTGLKESFSGQGYGCESEISLPLLMPILDYRVRILSNVDAVSALPYFRSLEEENPELSIRWDEDKNEISVCVMGEVQLEILKSLLKDKFNLDVAFDSGSVMYKETLTKPTIGVGHFEPLRHYAEVHLLMEPLPLGSGLIFETQAKTDYLAKNWQRLILTHLSERQHRGVLIGAPITDMKIVLINGRAHLKHTEGGDFRQATYRAVRQGLMMAESCILEPFYKFTIEVPSENVGRALTDLGKMNAEFSMPDMNVEKGTSIINGRGPVAAIKDYPKVLTSYTKGLGTISFMVDGYGPCHNPEEVMAEKAYDPLRDLRNTPDSVFCSHGAGVIVPYDDVYNHMHLSFDGSVRVRSGDDLDVTKSSRTVSDTPLGTEEINAIINKFSRSNAKDKSQGNNWKKSFGGKKIEISAPKVPITAPFPMEDADYVVVDGYNVIFAWKELNELAKENIDAARDSLLDTLSKFKSMTKAEVIAVFDAYRVKGHVIENNRFLDVQIIYTREDETADQYIERFTNDLGKKKKIVVVTSDGAEQVITRGQGCKLVSSREFQLRIEELTKQTNEKYNIK